MHEMDLLDQADQPEVLIDDEIRNAALAGDGYLIVKLEEEKRKAHAQEFAKQCRNIQDRIEEIKLEREQTMTEQLAFTQQLELAAAELRAAQDVAQERSIEYAKIQLKLGLLDGKIENTARRVQGKI